MSVSLLLVTQVHATLKRSNTLSDMNECYPSTIATEDQVRLAEEECLGQAATGQRDEYMKQKKYEPGSETGSSKKPITCILVFNNSIIATATDLQHVRPEPAFFDFSF